MKSQEDLVRHLITNGILKTGGIIKAFRTVDRSDFVTSDFQDAAYDDEALSIGFTQTISQPTTVAIMLELLGAQRGDKVMDVGSGSGWTTAILASIVGSGGAVIGLEIRPELVEIGRQNLAKYHLPQARIEQAGQELGLYGEAPFDRILVSAAARDIPPELIKQLKIGGVIVLPVEQSVVRVERGRRGNTISEYPGFVFVPLIH